MRILRKLNNNAIVCTDSKGREIVAMGKGIGYGDIGREVSLAEIDRSFYDVDLDGQNVMRDLSAEVVLFAAKILDIAENELPYQLTPNAVLLLADHIAFAMERQRKQIHVRMPLAYDVQQTYPVEYKIGKYAVDRVRKEFKIGLPNEEAAGIAMNLINSRYTAAKNDDSEEFDGMLEEITEIVEGHFRIIVDRDSFNYSRYATHLQYLFKRIHEKKTIDSENLRLYKNLGEEFPDISECVESIAVHIREVWGCELSEEEKLYLILHINRICVKE